MTAVEMEQEQMRVLLKDNNAELMEEVLSLRKALQKQKEKTQKVNLELQLTDLNTNTNINEMKMDWGDMMDQDDKDNEILALKKANEALSEKNFLLEKTLTEKQEELINMKEKLPEHHESKLSSEIQTLKSALHVQHTEAAEASKQLQDQDMMIEKLKTIAQIKMAESNAHWSRRMEVLKQQVQDSEKNNVCMDSQAQINYLQTQITSLEDLLQSQSKHVGLLQRQLLDERQHLARTFESHNKAMYDSHAQWDERWSTREEEMLTSMSILQSQHEQRMNGLTNRNAENLTKISHLESQLMESQAEWSDRYKTLQEKHLSTSKAKEERMQHQMEALMRKNIELQELALKTGEEKATVRKEQKKREKEDAKRRQRELKERETLEKTKLKDVKKEEKEKTGEGKHQRSFFWQKLLRKPHRNFYPPAS